MVVQGASANLTLREQQVLDLLCQGMADKEIGLQLGITCATVRTHVMRLREKLGAQNRTPDWQARPPPRLTALSRGSTIAPWTKI